MDFAFVCVVPLQGKNERVHHLAQPSPCWKFVQREGLKEMRKVTAFHFAAAEFIKHDIMIHLENLMFWTSFIDEKERFFGFISTHSRAISSPSSVPTKSKEWGHS